MSWRRCHIIMTVAAIAFSARSANASERQDAVAFIKAEALRCDVGDLDVDQRGPREFYVFPRNTESVELRPIGRPNEQQDAHWRCLAASAFNRHYVLRAPPVVWDLNGGNARATGAFWVAIANSAPSAAAAEPKSPDR
jgi:hypothetical protein